MPCHVALRFPCEWIGRKNNNNNGQTTSLNNNIIPHLYVIIANEHLSDVCVLCTVHAQRIMCGGCLFEFRADFDHINYNINTHSPPPRPLFLALRFSFSFSAFPVRLSVVVKVSFVETKLLFKSYFSLKVKSKCVAFKWFYHDGGAATVVLLCLGWENVHAIFF